MIFSYFFQAALGIALGISMGILPAAVWWIRKNRKGALKGATK